MNSPVTKMKITTPNKTVVELKDYITGREAREIQSVLLDGMTMDGDKQTVDPKITPAMQDKTIEIVVLSIGGEKENVLEKVLDLPNKDYNFIMAEIEKITGDTEKKTKQTDN